MKIGIYGKDGKPFNILIFMTKEEKTFLFHKAEIKTNRVVIYHEGENVIIRRAASVEEDNSHKIYDKKANSQISIYAGTYKKLGLGDPYIHGAFELKTKRDMYKGIPVIITKLADYLGIEKEVIGKFGNKTKEREIEPLYKPEENPSSEVRHTFAKAMSQPIPTVDLKSLLEWLNNDLKKMGAEPFIENGVVRARITTVL